jgi:5'(3')-deoxyribonucleotidase
VGKRNLFLDMDGTLINSIKRVVELFDEDYLEHKGYYKVHWTDINSWDFKELLLLDKKQVNDYFCDPRFFDHRLEYMDNAYEVINRLKNYFYIHLVSMGLKENLSLKQTWIQENLPFSNFIGCDFNNVNDKSHIDMSEGIIIDDVAKNLDSSSAEEKIVFGDIYPWNFESKYTRMYNCTDLEKYLMNIYKNN